MDFHTRAHIADCLDPRFSLSMAMDLISMGTLGRPWSNPESWRGSGILRQEIILLLLRTRPCSRRTSVIGNTRRATFPFGSTPRRDRLNKSCLRRRYALAPIWPIAAVPTWASEVGQI